MRNVIAFVVALGIVVAIFWLTRSKDKRPAPPAPVPVASGSTQPTTSPSPTTPTTDVSKVRRLDKETRKQLGEQIAAARERARASTTTEGAPSLDAPLTLEDVGPSLQDKLRESIPILAECFAKPGTYEAMARMTLLTDPELGTVIDTEAIEDVSGAPLDATLETCLRDAIDSLALPPLGARGGRLPLQYTFKFD